MGVPNSQQTTNFSAKYQLTTNFPSYRKYYSVITRIFFTSARQSLLGVGPTKIKV